MPKVVVGKRIVFLALLGALGLALAGPACAGGGFGGSGRGGFHGGRGSGLQHGSSLQHGSMFQHGGGFLHGSGLRFRVCNSNGVCVSGYGVGSVLPASDSSASYAYPEDAAPLDVPSPALQPRTKMEVVPALPRETCSPGGCYRLQGDGVTVPYRWVWLPTPPPPPAPAVLRYPSGRYEQQGDGISVPSRWVWIPDAPTAPPSTAPAAPASPSAPGPAAPIPSRYGELYRWVDDQGTVHWTQGLDTVPERYRTRPKGGTAG
jgi:hypothetical protein